MHPITLTALASFPQQLEAHYAAFPAQFTNWKPDSWEGVPSEALSAIEQVCHVRDVEVDGYHLRFARMLSETHPLLGSLDTDALVVERSYARANVAEVFAAFRAARLQTLALIESLTPEQWERMGEFEGYGPLTVRSLVHYLCSHDQQHLAGLQWLLGKVNAATAKNSRS
jgi:DinB superfamily